MPNSLSNVQQTEFDALVHAAYQSHGFLLRDTVRTKSDVLGATCQFRKIGSVVANNVAYQNTIAIQDPTFTALTATLLKYAAGTGVDEIQDLTVNFESKKELAMVVAMVNGTNHFTIGQWSLWKMVDGQWFGRCGECLIVEADKVHHGTAQ